MKETRQSLTRKSREPEFSFVFILFSASSRRTVMDNIDEYLQNILAGIFITSFLVNTGRVLQAIELSKECLTLLGNKALEKEKATARSLYIMLYITMSMGYRFIRDYTNAIECSRKLLVLYRESGERAKQIMIFMQLADLYKGQGKYKEAKEFYEKALGIMRETGVRELESVCCGKLGAALHSLGQYTKAKEYHEKALAMSRENGDRKEEATEYGNLGLVLQSLGEYGRAEECLKKALAIKHEIGDREAEAACYGNLGNVFHSRGEYCIAEEYFQKSLAIRREIGDRKGEASSYGNLGTVCHSFGEYRKAKEYHQKALAISKEIGDKHLEATIYGNLGAVFESLAEYGKAEECLAKALSIRKKIGDRKGEATNYSNLATVFQSLGEHIRAKEYIQKAIEIEKEIGFTPGLATDYAKLGTVFVSLAEYGKAKEYYEKALAITKEIGDRRGEGIGYGDLGTVFLYHGEFDKAKEYYEKALKMSKEIRDKKGEASYYGNLGTVLRALGHYAKAREYHDKALVISKEIGDVKAEFTWHVNLTWDMLSQGNIDEAFSNLLASIHKCEDMRDTILRDNDQFKISFLDENVLPYQLLSSLFCTTENPNEALYVVELGRARALADLMSAQYSVEKQISVNPQTWVGIERIIAKEGNCACLYISYYNQQIFLWILKANRPMLFRQKNVNDCFMNKGPARNVSEVFGDETFKRYLVLPQEHCEDRSWFPSNASHSTRKSSQEDSLEGSHLVEEDEDETQIPEPPSLGECYQMIIAPVVDLLDEPGIIIVPDRSLYNVPFAALKDESGEYLSASFRIRIVPSLTTLKLIQDSPADYHSQTGALIVGDPNVGHVLYKGRLEGKPSLPCAREEAELIGELLGVQPLLGKQATKQAVLQNINSVALIHFAAHGDAERGEIVLAPPRPSNRIPQEEDYLLTMADISQVRLRAKLVVLSCCHSASGQIRSEGVVGIARAFLGSGARSVLVALWAIEDRATKQFMSRFYEHLVRGESASESLHQTMKWMRGNGFSDVGQWAPFMLIGDNVTFDFAK